MNIPEIVKTIAYSEGCNSITYVGCIGEDDFYGIGEVDEEGRAVPNGLPALVKWNGKDASVICGHEALDILSHF